MNNADTLYGRAKELYESYKDLLRSTNPFANNLAQALELVYFTERAIDLIDEALAKWPIRPRDEVALKDASVSQLPKPPRVECSFTRSRSRTEGSATQT